MFVDFFFNVFFEVPPPPPPAFVSFSACFLSLFVCLPSSFTWNFQLELLPLLNLTCNHLFSHHFSDSRNSPKIWLGNQLAGFLFSISHFPSPISHFQFSTRHFAGLLACPICIIYLLIYLLRATRRDVAGTEALESQSKLGQNWNWNSNTNTNTNSKTKTKTKAKTSTNTHN